MAAETDESVILLFLALAILSSDMFLLLLPFLVLPPDVDACFLDCELALGFALLLALLFARPLDLVLALVLDLTPVLDLELDFLMIVQKTMIIMRFGSDVSLG